MKQLGIAGLLLSFLAAGCGGKESKKEYVGLGVALAGHNEQSGKEIRRGAELALTACADAVPGRKLVLLSNDTASKPQQAKALAVRMIHANNVIAMIGGDAEAGDHEAAWVCQNSPAPDTTPFLSAAGSSERLTELGPFVFAVGLSEEARGRALAVFALKELKAERFAVLHLQPHEKEKPDGLADSFVSGFAAAARGKPVQVHRGSLDDLKPAVARLKENERPDAVVLAGAGDGLRRLRALLGATGLEGVALLAGGVGEPDAVLDASTAELDGLHFCTAFSADDLVAADFVKKFQAEHKSRPTAFAALGHDATRLLSEAGKNADSLEPARLRESLAQVTAPGVGGPISFDENRRTKRPALIVQVVKGNLKLVKKLAADGY